MKYLLILLSLLMALNLDAKPKPKKPKAKHKKSICQKKTKPSAVWYKGNTKHIYK